MDFSKTGDAPDVVLGVATSLTIAAGGAVATVGLAGGGGGGGDLSFRAGSGREASGDTATTCGLGLLLRLRFRLGILGLVVVGIVGSMVGVMDFAGLEKQ